MEFIETIIEVTGAWIILRFQKEKLSLDDIIRSKRLKVWAVGIISWIVLLTLFGALAKYGFKH